MAKTKSSLARQIADLSEERAPREFDPEEDVDVAGDEAADSAGDGEEEDDLAGTEHYVSVGKSKLRKPEEIPLGPQYVGSRVSRQQLLNGDDEDEEDEGEDDEQDDDVPAEQGSDVSEDSGEPLMLDEDVDIDDDDEIDSDEAFGESDEEKFENFSFRGSSKPKGVNGVGKAKRRVAADFMSASEDEDDEEDIEDDSEEIGKPDHRYEDEDLSEEEEDVESGSDEEDAEDDDDEDEEDDAAEQQRRAELQQIMKEEQKSVVATISQAAKADAAKGDAVKQQRKIFDSLLNLRIRLQKALVATNSLSLVEEKEEDQAPESEPYEAAEQAAINLLNTLESMRFEFDQTGPSKAGQKRKRPIELDTPASEIWARIQAAETSTSKVRQATIEKWSAKVRSTTAVTVSRKLNNTASQTITDVLQDQLANSERLVKRTKMPRSCAPLQVKAKIAEDPNIYDDADFYQLLLKELVDQRMADSSTGGVVSTTDGSRPVAAWTAVKEAKTKKHVDTRASKGRKMRYTVHEKLQNFMAPEDRGNWEPEAVDRFFATLLGQRVDLGEEVAADDGDEDRVLAPEEALMLFRS